MNWPTRGLTSKKVGFVQEGNVCEGGNCEHLNEGDAAYGHSSENDSFGSEMYLMCKPCYLAFCEEQRVALTGYNDCQREFPRNELKRYIPYYLDGSPSEMEDAKLWVCPGCLEGDRHKRRLQNDEDHRELDRMHDDGEDEWDLSMDDGPDDDTLDPEDD